MSGTAIMRALLAADPIVLALVPANRIRLGGLPQGTTLPAISISTVYADEFRTVARLNAKKQTRERVQVTVYTSQDSGSLGYTQLKTILKACSVGRGVKTGTIVGFEVKSVLPESENPEIPPGDDKIYEQSRDFMVTFVEAN